LAADEGLIENDWGSVQPYYKENVKKEFFSIFSNS